MEKTVEFKPLSKTLKKLKKTGCLFCGNKATQAANRGISEIRCCDDQTCMKLAEEVAKLD